MYAILYVSSLVFSPRYCQISTYIWWDSLGRRYASFGDFCSTFDVIYSNGRMAMSMWAIALYGLQFDNLPHVLLSWLAVPDEIK